MDKLKEGLKLIRDLLLQSYYQHCRKRKKLNQKCILIESKNGMDLGSNLFYILKELQKEDYQDYQLLLLVEKVAASKIIRKLKDNGLERIRTINLHSPAYYWAIATAKYIFVDTSLERVFVKRAGQILVNTWHGTPLKKMGRDEEKSAHLMWNVQRNFFMSDYLLYPSESMMNIMLDAYQLRHLYTGSILLAGYPRNAIFFIQNNIEEEKKRRNLHGKQVFMYMPTWRGTVKHKDNTKQVKQLQSLLQKLDSLLPDHIIVYVKLHPFVEENLVLSNLHQVKIYQENDDVYDFLTCCDGLITDYSSILFDFANTRRKIILFTYDQDDYKVERGLYHDLENLPFPITTNVSDLVEELKQPKQYDDSEFIQKYCCYDNKNATSNLCKYILKGEHLCKELTLPKPSKENVLLYGSEFEKNGLTTALLSLLKYLDRDTRNYYVGIDETALSTDPSRLSLLPKDVGFIPTENGVYRGISEAIASILYFRLNKRGKWISRQINEVFTRELHRRFCGVKFQTAIQYAGYEVKHIQLFQRFPNRRIIFVHNDMIEEIDKRKNQHLLTLQDAYQNYDHVAVVTSDLIPSTQKIAGNAITLSVVNNCLDYIKIQEKAKKPLQFDEETTANITLDELNMILNSDKLKFITVGRFSPEKGHKMLMQAFEEFTKTYPDAYLIIIGGHGPLYEETLSYANNSKSSIIVIKSLSNPMNIMSQCDLFILSSYYEGLGLTLLEADALKIPTIATNVQGPKGFVTEHGGTLVEPSIDGLTKGMLAYMKGQIKPMLVDYNLYNKKAIASFETLLK
ncbi:MAG: CDP-glycerol glycerophosphotransferase family protein [Lachnospiraceae bacterium]|nr:CDP-glycerol glycerophosphotransferase family protein [Lachnospiraceae bacterium]